MVQKIQRRCSHSSAHAAGTKRSRAATERDQPPLRTVLARDQGEASLQESTIEILLQLVADKIGQRRARESLLGRGVEGLQVFAHHSVQRALFGLPALVAGWTAARPDRIRRLGEWSYGTGSHPLWVSANRPHSFLLCENRTPQTIGGPPQRLRAGYRPPPREVTGGSRAAGSSIGCPLPCIRKPESSRGWPRRASR